MSSKTKTITIDEDIDFTSQALYEKASRKKQEDKKKKSKKPEKQGKEKKEKKHKTTHTTPTDSKKRGRTESGMEVFQNALESLVKKTKRTSSSTEEDSHGNIEDIRLSEENSRHESNGMQLVPIGSRFGGGGDSTRNALDILAPFVNLSCAYATTQNKNFERREHDIAEAAKSKTELKELRRIVQLECRLEEEEKRASKWKKKYEALSQEFTELNHRMHRANGPPPPSGLITSSTSASSFPSGHGHSAVSCTNSNNNNNNRNNSTPSITESTSAVPSNSAPPPDSLTEEVMRFLYGIVQDNPFHNAISQMVYLDAGQLYVPVTGYYCLGDILHNFGYYDSNAYRHLTGVAIFLVATTSHCTLAESGAPRYLKEHSQQRDLFNMAHLTQSLVTLELLKQIFVYDGSHYTNNGKTYDPLFALQPKMTSNLPLVALLDRLPFPSAHLTVLLELATRQDETKQGTTKTCVICGSFAALEEDKRVDKHAAVVANSRAKKPIKVKTTNHVMKTCTFLPLIARTQRGQLVAANKKKKSTSETTATVEAVVKQLNDQVGLLNSLYTREVKEALKKNYPNFFGVTRQPPDTFGQCLIDSSGLPYCPSRLEKAVKDIENANTFYEGIPYFEYYMRQFKTLHQQDMAFATSVYHSVSGPAGSNASHALYNIAYLTPGTTSLATLEKPATSTFWPSKPVYTPQTTAPFPSFPPNFFDAMPSDASLPPFPFPFPTTGSNPQTDAFALPIQNPFLWPLPSGTSSPASTVVVTDVTDEKEGAL